MMNVTRALKSDRLMKALTGLSCREFLELLETFTQVFNELEKERKPQRARKEGGGRKGSIKSVEQKLFFILFYLKAYPTFDVAGFFFRVVRSRPCEWYKLYLPVLEKALGRKCCLPKRQIRSEEEFFQAFPEVQDIFIDGTERRVQRPKKPKNQKKYYSGKKKAHTRKNTIITDVNKRILYISPTKSGKTHDKKMVDKEGILHNIPPWIGKWVDTGYQGIQGYVFNVVMPKKGTKKNPLTPQEKKENKVISSFRICVEHSIGGMKRFNCLSNVYRNKKGIDDSFVNVCAALWNFHLIS